jgi:hypothetical protein
MKFKINDVFKETGYILSISIPILLIYFFIVPENMKKWFIHGVAIFMAFVALFLVIRNRVAYHKLGKDPEIKNLRKILEKTPDKRRNSKE